jgi:hypothetical protein
MLKLIAKDLVIRLDEQRNVLQFLVPKGSGENGDLRVFYEMSEEELSKHGELEHQIGVTLLSFLSATYSSAGFRLKQYRNVAESLTDQWEAERTQGLKKKSAKGDATAKYELGMQRVAHGLRTKSRAAMSEAETLFEEAAKLGNNEASEYLTNLWPALKERSDRTFK